MEVHTLMSQSVNTTINQFTAAQFPANFLYPVLGSIQSSSKHN